MAKLNYCPNCGEPLKANYKVCPACGELLEEKVQEDDPFEQNRHGNTQATYQKTKNYEDEGNTFGWAVVGFFIPLLGLILFLLWQKERPLSAKSAGTGALVSVVISVIFWMFIVTAATSGVINYSN